MTYDCSVNQSVKGDASKMEYFLRCSDYALPHYLLLCYITIINKQPSTVLCYQTQLYKHIFKAKSYKKSTSYVTQKSHVWTHL